MTPARPPISVIAVDDNPLIIEAIRSLLASRDDMVLVGHETTGTRGLRLAREHAPDVAIVDLALPDTNGLVLVQRMTSEMPSTKVVVLSTVEDRCFIRRAFEVGAKAYVSKRSPGERLLQSITAVCQSGLYVDPAVAPRVLCSGNGRPTQEAGKVLTAREAEVVRFIALGYTMKEIAAELGCSVKSIETYKGKACGKLDLGTRKQLVRYAFAQGWLAAI